MKKIMAAILALMLILSMAAQAESYIYLQHSTEVHTGPGLGYSMKAQLNAGSTVGYLQQSCFDSRGVMWYRVRLDNGSGWLQATHAILTDEAGFATYAAGASASDGDFGLRTGEVTVSGNVNVRSGPGVGHSIVKTMHSGETADYLGSAAVDDRGVVWYSVRFKGVTGWVSSVYAELTGGWEYAQTTVEAVSGDSNVRTGPGLGYGAVGTLYKGDSAPYLGATSTDERGVAWYFISFGGQTGWVSSKYTELTGKNDAPAGGWTLHWN